MTGAYMRRQRQSFNNGRIAKSQHLTKFPFINLKRQPTMKSTSRRVFQRHNIIKRIDVFFFMVSTASRGVAWNFIREMGQRFIFRISSAIPFYYSIYFHRHLRRLAVSSSTLAVAMLMSFGVGVGVVCVYYPVCFLLR